MAKKGQKSSKAEREAGWRNLMRWKQENPEAAKLANIRDGVYSQTIRNRYADKNTAEGTALLAIMKAIEKDIGKPLDARQSLLISLIRSKVIIIMQIGKYLESQEDVVNYAKGTVAHVVDKTFFHASKSLRSALNELYGDDRIKGKKGITYEDVLESIKAKEAARAPVQI